MAGNSIYSYYRRITDRCYVAITYRSAQGEPQVRFIWEPLARKISVTGYEDFDLFITGTMRRYEVHEGITGAILLHQTAMASRVMRRAGLKLFTDCLPAEIRQRGGPGFINGAIVNFIVDYGHQISPRYEIEPSETIYQKPQ